MTREYEEYPTIEIPRIEFSGTPFPARDKFLIHNALEDMITERNRLVRGFWGISEFFWSSLASDINITEYYETRIRVEDVLSTSVKKDLPILLLDGAFSMMVVTEIMRQKHMLSPRDEINFIKGMLPFAEKEDLIVLTIVKPRAALSRLIYPLKEGHDMVFEKYLQFFNIYNKAAEKVLLEFKSDLPPVEVIDVKGDNFSRDEVFFRTANTALSFLGLPTIEKWSEHLNKDKPRRIVTPMFGRTLAGLTSEEISVELRRWDWSVKKLDRNQPSFGF